MPSYGGRLADVPELELPESPDYEVFSSPAKCKGPRQTQGAQRCDEREQEWRIRPTRAGSINIPGPKLVYFDPTKKKYKTSPARNFTIEVTSPPPQERAGGQRSSHEPEGPQLQGIRDVSDPEATHGVQSYSVWVNMALLGAPLFFLGLLGYERLAQRRDRPPVLAQHDQRPEKRRRPLLRSISQPAQELYAELHSVATQYLADRFQVSTRGKTYAQLKSLLREQGVQDELTDGFVNELETLDFARFTGMDHERNVAESVGVMAAFIQDVEKVVS